MTRAKTGRVVDDRPCRSSVVIFAHLITFMVVLESHHCTPLYIPARMLFEEAAARPLEPQPAAVPSGLLLLPGVPSGLDVVYMAAGWDGRWPGPVEAAAVCR